MKAMRIETAAYFSDSSLDPVGDMESLVLLKLMVPVLDVDSYKRQILKKVPAARCIYFGNYPNKKYINKLCKQPPIIPEYLGKENQQKVSTVKVVLVPLTVPSLAVLINANESSGVKCVLH